MTISHAAKEMGKYCDSVTGVEGSSGINGSSKQAAEEEEEEEVPEPPRNFTMKQLQHFNGKIDEKTEEPTPVYLSVQGTVFDVSKGRDFYGPGGPYEMFAGRECGAALATMSFDESLLDDLSACETLGVGDKAELENWLEKFEHYRCYPIRGRLVPEGKLPSADRIISMEELAKYDGMNQEIPEGEHAGYATRPIYLGALDKVFDVSFGGVPMYGKDGPYNRFAGKDASRALALMSFDPKDVENTDISDLEEKQVKVLKDWVKSFEEKKGYPVVGKLDKKL
mmetsp:Transcript_6647/g.11838  ORF Transcript_6647/g.11838 Transcript_6647/m.11838 type:complete len:281 (+) Transcript_6647:93-935(+)